MVVVHRNRIMEMIINIIEYERPQTIHGAPIIEKRLRIEPIHQVCIWIESIKFYKMAPSVNLGFGSISEERRIVYVGRLEEEVTKEELRRKFSVYGHVKQVSLHYKE